VTKNKQDLAINNDVTSAISIQNKSSGKWRYEIIQMVGIRKMLLGNVSRLITTGQKLMALKEHIIALK
jgi:hypothetical protein